MALQLLRALEEQLLRSASHNLIARTRGEVALYVLNHKRAHLRELEDRFSVTLIVQADESVTGHQPFLIEKGEIAAPPAPRRASAPPSTPIPSCRMRIMRTMRRNWRRAPRRKPRTKARARPSRPSAATISRASVAAAAGVGGGGERESRADDANGSDEDGAEGDDETESASARATTKPAPRARTVRGRQRRAPPPPPRPPWRSPQSPRGRAGSGDETSADAEADGESAEGEGLESEGQEPARALSFPGQETFAEIEATSSEAPSHEASSHEPPVTADAPAAGAVVVPEVLAEAPAPAAEPEAPAAPAPVAGPRCARRHP